MGAAAAWRVEEAGRACERGHATTSWSLGEQRGLGGRADAVTAWEAEARRAGERAQWPTTAWRAEEAGRASFLLLLHFWYVFLTLSSPHEHHIYFHPGFTTD